MVESETYWWANFSLKTWFSCFTSVTLRGGWGRGEEGTEGETHSLSVRGLADSVAFYVSAVLVPLSPERGKRDVHPSERGRLCIRSTKFADFIVLARSCPYILCSSWCRIEQLALRLQALSLFTVTKAADFHTCSVGKRSPMSSLEDGEQINRLLLHKQRQIVL